MKLDERRKENVLMPEPTPGLVTGIDYSDEKPSAIMAGEVVYEGDMIDGINVVEIHRDNVES